MGRLMLSLLLSEQNEPQTISNSIGEHQISIEDRVQQNTVPKWSASNAFDPDGDEFWSGDDVVYEAFLDPNEEPLLRDTLDEEDEERRERLEEEAHLIASGNESRRRRREQPWISMEGLLTPEPQDAVGEPVAAVPLNQRVRIYGEAVIMEHSVIRREAERMQMQHPGLTTRGIRTLHSSRATPNSLHPFPPIISRHDSGNSNSTLSAHSAASPQDMVTDLAFRTASPLPFVTFHRPARIQHSPQPQRSRHRRRESQPVPSSISLMG